MDVQERKVNQTLIMSLKGRIDNFCAAILHDELQTIINTGCFSILIDLRETDYLSAGCLRAFLKGNARLQRHHGHCALLHLSDAAREIITFTGADHMLQIFDDEDQALKALSIHLKNEQKSSPQQNNDAEEELS